jgi:putative nucleotidyltransferase with HDIG domain
MNLVDAILQSVTQLPPFPAVIQRVLELVENPKTSAHDVVEVIQYDQAVTANVLMVCNSAYFGLRKPVHSLTDALVRIGFNTLVEIILTRGTAFLFYQSCQGYQLQKGELWRHSVACAILSQILAERVRHKKSAVQFTATLLHDVGKIVLSGFVKDHFEQIHGLVQEKNLSFLEAERETLGIDHAELGGRIAEGWKFPRNIIAGIRYHHTPFLAEEFQDLVSLAYLCDVVALMTGIGGGADGLSYRGYKDIMEQYDLKEKDLEAVISELDTGKKKVEGMLNIQ